MAMAHAAAKMMKVDHNFIIQVISFEGSVVDVV